MHIDVFIKRGCLGKLLRQHRLLVGLKQREVSKKLGYTNSSHLSNIEKGEKIPSREAFLKLVKIYNIDHEELAEQMCVGIKANILDFLKGGLEAS